jgi:hypothetical protein
MGVVSIVALGTEAKRIGLQQICSGNFLGGEKGFFICVNIGFALALYFHVS